MNAEKITFSFCEIWRDFADSVDKSDSKEPRNNIIKWISESDIEGKSRRHWLQIEITFV